MPDLHRFFRHIESHNFRLVEEDWLALLACDPRVLLSRALDTIDPVVLHLYAQALYTILELRAQGTTKSENNQGGFSV